MTPDPVETTPDGDAGDFSWLLTRQTVTGLPPLTCKNVKVLYVVDVVRAAAWQLRCRRNTCSHCLPLNARRRALAITISGPERMICLTKVAEIDDPKPLATARIRVKRMREILTEQGFSPGEWSWTMEQNPAGTGFHAHVVQRGSYVPQRALQSASQRAGAGIPHITKIRGSASGSARYGLKTFGASGYGLKTFKGDHGALVALAQNNGRLEHHSPKFFHIRGKAVGVRKVETYAVEQLTTHCESPTVTVSPDKAVFLLSPSGNRELAILAKIKTQPVFRSRVSRTTFE